MNTYITNHMDDIKRALLGDHEAARRLTDAGVLLPCPFCGGNSIE
nr:MAG TPA: restriction alleviation protein [Caudoviricetes sp.]